MNQTCSFCGTELEPNAIFCTGCGARLETPPGPAVAPAPGQEPAPAAVPYAPAAQSQAPAPQPSAMPSPPQAPAAAQPPEVAAPPVVAPSPVPAATPPTGPKSRNKLVAIVAGVLAVAVLATLFLVILKPWQGNDIPVPVSTSIARAPEPEPEPEPDIITRPSGEMGMTDVPPDLPMFITAREGKYVVSTAMGTVTPLQDEDGYISRKAVTQNGSAAYYIGDSGNSDSDYPQSLIRADLLGNDTVLMEDVAAYQVMRDGETVYAAGYDGLFRFSPEEEEGEKIAPNANLFSVSPNGSKLVAGQYANIFYQNLKTGEIVWLDFDQSVYRLLSISDDGNTIAYYGDDDTMYIHDREEDTYHPLNTRGYRGIYTNRTADELLVLCEDGMYLYRDGRLHQLDSNHMDDITLLSGPVYAYAGNTITIVLNTSSLDSIFWTVRSGSASGNDRSVQLYHSDASATTRKVDDIDYTSRGGPYISADYSKVFYLKDGDLQRVQLGDSFTTETIAEDVYNFAISPDGNLAAYRLEDRDYTLACWQNGTTTTIADNVNTFWLGGREGKVLTYNTFGYREGTAAAYYCELGQEPVEVARGEVYAVYPAVQDGSFCYTMGDYDDYDLCLYSGGETKTLVQNCEMSLLIEGKDWYYDLNRVM